MNGYRCTFRCTTPTGGLVRTRTIIHANSRTEAERILKAQYNNVSVISIEGGY